MYTVKVIVTILNVLMIILFMAFSKGARWKTDKATIIGFGFMTVLYMANIGLIWMQ